LRITKADTRFSVSSWPVPDPVHRVSIVPRGQALGVTYQRPESDRYNIQKRTCWRDRRRARWTSPREKSSLRRRPPGAQNDIEQATAIARDMVTRWE
jgi:cell division protease FtsH